MPKKESKPSDDGKPGAAGDPSKEFKLEPDQELRFEVENEDRVGCRWTQVQRWSTQLR